MGVKPKAENMPLAFDQKRHKLKTMKKARALKRGDTIGVAAPSSPFDRTLFQHGVKALEGLGFEVRFRKDIFDQNRYFAGTEKRRAEELMELMADESVHAIMFARGGYGCQRVIPLLDAEALKKNAKPVIGFSDITALLTFFRQGAGIPTFYGPVITQLGKGPSDFTNAGLLRALTTPGPLGNLPCGKARTMKPGTASGKLVGGCLTLINSSIGTPYELDTEDSILFIEDAGEKIYALDRMLTQLKAGGSLDRARAIVIGDIIAPEGEKHDLDAMLTDALGGFSGPVIEGFPAGHSGEFVTLPMGVNVTIDATDKDRTPSIEVTEGLLT